MKKEENNLFIWLLEFGESNQQSQVSCRNMLNEAVQQGLCNTRNEPTAEVLTKLFYECFDLEKLKPQHGHNPDVLMGMPTSLKAEYYFRLLEFRELQLARETSMQANKNASAAHDQSQRSFRASVAAVLISILVAVITTSWQLNSSLTINPTQIEHLVNALKSTTSTSGQRRTLTFAAKEKPLALSAPLQNDHQPDGERALDAPVPAADSHVTPPPENTAPPAEISAKKDEAL